MTVDQIAQEVGLLWNALTLAAQGAFTNAHPANGHKNITQARAAYASFVQAKEATLSAIERLFVEFATRATAINASIEAGRERVEAIEEIGAVAAQLQSQLVKAIRTGATSAPAALLPNAHGAIGQLIGQRQGILQVIVRDGAGRQWKDSRRLVETIARGCAVQIQVIATISDMRAAGDVYAYVGGVEYPLHELAAMRSVFFHPNSKEMPRAIDVHA